MPPPSTAHRSLSVLLLCAVCALVGCDDGVGSNIGNSGDTDPNGVDPDRRDNRPPAEMGVEDGPPAPPPDAAPDREPDPEPDRGGGEIDEEMGPPDRGPEDAGPPDRGPECQPMATRPCPDDACGDSFQTCIDGMWGPCETPAEVCDEADNDCDGATDEGFADLGEPCAVGVGVCAAEGTWICGADGARRCSAEPGPVEVEGCNTLDDDCDGIIDEDFGGGAPCTHGIGECTVPSVEGCIDERIVCLGEADAPGAELCNGRDDDCDGVTDEDYALGEDCSVGLGPCQRPGVRACGDDQGGACVGEAGEPSPEACNGVDDDCDGAVDEGTVDPAQDGPCFEGEGACRAEGRVVCDGDGELRCSAVPGPPADERCNGVDDDCDGLLDEGYRLGAPCTAGTGVCAMDGVRICGANGSWRCSAEEGPPGEETCNGLDDDCDGEPDEGYALDERCEIGLGVCERGGRTVCADDGDEVRCDAVIVPPTPEVCNGRDDDCDGRQDEGFDVGAPCVGGEGARARDGRIGCVADGSAECLAEPGDPAFERCDGTDEDCDGRIDEGLGLGGPCAVGVGACVRPGRIACADDGAVACEGEPGAPDDERCNAIDDDCDGEIDEDIEWQGIELGDDCREGIGACEARGRVVCDGEGAATCDAEPGAPRDELCDGADDDCDGAVDEGFDLGAPCAVGVGACARRGQRICAAGGVSCSVAPGPEMPEICNGLDDDCDGAVDEGQTLDGQPLGARCTKGEGRCLAGGEVVCRDGVPTCDAVPGAPRPEICDGVDDDCDGAADEGLGLGDGCTVGVGACARDGVQICGDDGDIACTATAGEPREERCDGADDDCDGEADEDYDLGQRCAVGIGACEAAGLTVCAPGGRGDRCGAVPGEPTDEACNTVDDDCDGQTDEGFGLGEICAVGLGECRAEGNRVCADDGDATCDAVAGEPAPAEACDRRDDDCDGAIDEDYALGEPCVSGLGICARDGVRICAADGGGACDAEPGDPEEETCNDLDDDCDGIVDEGVDDQAGVAFGICGPRYRSCLEALRAGGVESGVYRISPENAAGREVWCDQTTDGGGWTLVMATTDGPTDGLGGWHEGLLDPFPEAGADGVWAGLSHLGQRPFDLRFACRGRAGGAAGDVGFDVDIAFYGTPWYRQFIRGGEAASCIATGDGEGQALPARKDLLSGQVRAHAQPYPAANGGRLVAEPRCQSADSFLVDFDDGGVRGAGLDGTDWGTFAERQVCGALVEGGQWLVYAREDIPHPLGPIGLINLPQLAEPIEAAGFEPVPLTVDDPELLDQLDPAILPAVFIGRYAQDWPALPAALEPLLGCYTFDGGSVVTEFDGFSLLGTRLAPDFVYLDGAPNSWGWLSAVPGGGHVRGVDSAIDVLDGVDPVTRGLGQRFSAGEGSERFLSLNRVHPTVPLPMAILATFEGDGAQFPNPRYPAVVRGNQCGGSLLAGTFDYADAPAEPAIVRLVGNLAAAAVSPPDDDLPDVCGGGLGEDRCERARP